MTLSNVSFSYFLRNDYLDHFDTLGENFDFDTFKKDTFESVCVDAHSHMLCCFSVPSYLLVYIGLHLPMQYFVGNAPKFEVK